MKQRKKPLQKYEVCTKGKVQIINFSNEENVDILDFWEYKEIFFNAGSW